MPKSKPLTDIEGEVRELTAADMKRFQNAKQTLPGTLLKSSTSAARKRLRPRSALRFAFLPKWFSAFVTRETGGKRALILRLRIGLSRMSL